VLVVLGLLAAAWFAINRGRAHGECERYRQEALSRGMKLTFRGLGEKLR